MLPSFIDYDANLRKLLLQVMKIVDLMDSRPVEPSADIVQRVKAYEKELANLGRLHRPAPSQE